MRHREKPQCRCTTTVYDVHNSPKDALENLLPVLLRLRITDSTTDSTITTRWRRSIVVRTLVSAGELSLSCARLLAGWVITLRLSRPLSVSQHGQLSHPSLRMSSDPCKLGNLRNPCRYMDYGWRPSVVDWGVVCLLAATVGPIAH